jgi:Tfp pilus assembly protein PilW
MRKTRESGFTLLELMAAMAFSMLIAGSVFLVLNTSVQRYQMESQVLDSFQTARLAIDQMTRDIHGAGFPPANSGWSFPSSQPTALPFAWDPGYVTSTSCTVGNTCTIPTQSDLIIEGNISPTTGSGVQWIRYTLSGTTLMRGVVSKIAGTDPDAATTATGVMLPYVDNVINNAQSVSVFTYECNDNSTPPIPTPCTNVAVPAPNNTAPYIRQVGITLIVQSAQPDLKTGQFRTVSLHSEALVLNPAR